MKSEILQILRNQEGYVSGQELCSRFGVSRTAVWKVIRQLKEEGYQIEAVPNKGYHMIESADVVSAAEIKSRLHTRWAGCEIHFYETVDSTNSRAKQMAENGAPHGTLVLAERQEKGRGRRGRSWNTASGTAVAMSLILRPQLLPEQASMMTLVMGTAAVRACNRFLNGRAKIKWPNDIVVDGKKICGILTEMSAEMEAIHYLVIGAGFNVNTQEFPEEIKDAATSISQALGHKISRSECIQYVLEAFEECYESFLEKGDLSGLLKEYNENLINLDREVKVLDPKGGYTGISRGINEKGELLVERPDGSMEEVFAGEVSVRGVYGYV